MCEAVSHRLRTRSCCGGCEQRPVSACSRRVGEQVVRRAAGNDNAGELRTRYAAVSPRPGMPCQCVGHPHTATDHCRPLASIPASPAENDVALSRHCAGCRPHPPIRGTEDLRSCCCALKARAEHRVIMLLAAACRQHAAQCRSGAAVGAHDGAAQSSGAYAQNTHWTGP